MKKTGRKQQTTVNGLDTNKCKYFIHLQKSCKHY